MQSRRFAVLLSWLIMIGGRAGALPVAVPLRDGMTITQDTRIAPGRYALGAWSGGRVQVSGHDFVVDFGGAKLVGDAEQADPKAFAGIGLHITDARNVVIKNADIRGCQWGVIVERSSNITLQNCVISRNADLPPGTVIDESGREPEDQHGGGILIRDSAHCTVRKCRAEREWDGVDVIRSDDNVIEDSDLSYCGNWGLHLWNASRNTFRRNRAVWCTTGGGTLFQALTGWQTYDAQAVAIDHNSNENLIVDNDLRFGGDGIFIRANEGGLVAGVPVPPRNASNRNILRGNDCSFSPNNAIEVDFCDDTIIENNNCSCSHYGMWLGYSRRCKVRGNVCVNDSAKAVEIENGQDDTFENNVMGYDTPREGQPLVMLRQNGRDKTPSGPHHFHGNVFWGVGGTPISRKDTVATSDGDSAFDPGFRSGVGVKFPEPLPQGGGVFAMTGPPMFAVSPRSVPIVQTVVITVGRPAKLTGTRLNSGIENVPTTTPCVVEVDGIPVMPRSDAPDMLTFAMPADNWARAAESTVTVRVFNGLAWSEPVTSRLVWPDDGSPRIDSVMPDPAQVGGLVTITGANLNGPDLRVLFNGRPVTVVSSGPNKLVVKTPEGTGKTMRYNIVAQYGTGDTQTRTWPVTLLVSAAAVN